MDQGEQILSRARKAISDIKDGLQRLLVADRELDQKGWAEELGILWDSTFPFPIKPGDTAEDLSNMLNLFSEWDRRLAAEGVLPPGSEEWRPGRRA